MSGQREAIRDLSVPLSCGCVIVYNRGDLQRGQMFLCRRHINEDAFDSLRIVSQVAQRVERGERSFEISGR